jgi:hypothetical protein
MSHAGRFVSPGFHDGWVDRYKGNHEGLVLSLDRPRRRTDAGERWP